MQISSQPRAPWLITRPLAAFAIALAAMALLPAHVAAFELTDCRVTVQSFDADGQPLDTAIGDTDGGEGGTRTDPFLVDNDGTVRYEADTGDQVITNQTWSVEVFLIPTPVRGGGANEDQQTSAEGEIDVGSSLPIRVNGLYFVSGQISGDGGACRGSAWVRLVSDPPTSTVTTIPFWIALLIMAAGAIVMWLARPGVVLPLREVRR